MPTRILIVIYLFCAITSLSCTNNQIRHRQILEKHTEEFERFATTEGLSLPPCQYSPELYVVSRNLEAAVILVGDAVHTFPPDLGEGVNSGLEDVLCLDEALMTHGKLGDVARDYGAQRGPEVGALDIELPVRHHRP